MDREIGNSQLGSVYKFVYKDLESDFNIVNKEVRYMILSKKYISSNKFLENINISLNLLNIKTIQFVKADVNKLVIKGDVIECQNVYLSDNFLSVCGYNHSQLEHIDNIANKSNSVKYYRCSDIINLHTKIRYCKLHQPPKFLDLFSSNIQQDENDFNNEIATKICGITNCNEKYEVVVDYPTEWWYDICRIRGGVLHMFISGVGLEAEKLETRVRHLFVHLEICTKYDFKFPKMIFCDLETNIRRQSTSHTFVCKFKNVLTLQQDCKIGISSLRLPQFKSIFGKHKSFRVTQHGLNEKIISDVIIPKVIFQSSKSFISELNRRFEKYQISFRMNNMYISVLNVSDKYDIDIHGSKDMMRLFGCGEYDYIEKIHIRQSEEFCFEYKCDLNMFLPKILTIRFSLLCNNSSTVGLDEEKHMIFFNGNYSDQAFNFDDTHHTKAGVFSGIQINIVNPMMLDFDFKEYQAHCCIMIKH